MPVDITNAMSAIAALGPASFAVVDASKSFGGGASTTGFSHIERVLTYLFPAGTNKTDFTTPLGFGAIRQTLFANWINGVALADQKSIAKTLIKMRLDKGTASQLAQATGVDAGVLVAVATKYAGGGALTPEEQNVAGRFDLVLLTLLDEGYQRADQAYRNGSRLFAMMVSVALALGGNYAMGDQAVSYVLALVIGLLAAPLAPMSKDLTSALQTAVKTMQTLRK